MQWFADNVEVKTRLRRRYATTRHQDLMSVLKSNYGNDVMLATPGNHVEEMMHSSHPVHPPPNYHSLGGMGLHGNRGGHQGGGIPHLTPQSTGLQKNPLMRTSYDDAFAKNGNQTFERWDKNLISNINPCVILIHYLDTWMVDMLSVRCRSMLTVTDHLLYNIYDLVNYNITIFE